MTSATVSTATWNVLLLFVLTFCLPTSIGASVTVMDTGKRYRSRVDHHYGKAFVRGYEYMARLQYLPHNIKLCPVEGTQEWNLTVVPPDKLPVALLASDLGCSLDEKVLFVKENIYPKGVVQYIIIDGSKSHLRSLAEEVEQDKTQSSALDFRANWVLGEDKDEEDMDRNEINVFPDNPTFDMRFADGDFASSEIGVVHVSTSSAMNLLEIARNQNLAQKQMGGPRIILDGGWSFGNRRLAVWMIVSIALSACACIFLVSVHNGSIFLFDEEQTTTQQPQRERRRRLTREQVRRLFPPYVFDGTGLSPHYTIHHPPPALPRVETQEGASAEGLLESVPPETPQPCDLCDCSICLDEYEPGDKVRVLPCNHAFHYRCIGRWLVERSATCPLCKVELWDDEEQTSSSEGEEAADPAAGEVDNAPVYGWQQLVNMLSFGVDGGHQNLVTATAANHPTDETSQTRPEEGEQQPYVTENTPNAPSFLRRLLDWRRGRTLAEQHGVTLNSNSLAEPLLQAENGQMEATSPNRATHTDETTVEPRPDPPEGNPELVHPSD